MAGAVATLTVKVDRMADAASDPMLLATDLAEALVREQVPFREAHEVVGEIVAHCVEKRLDLRSLSHDDLKGFHPAFPSGAGELLSLERAVEERNLIGGTSRARVEESLARAEAEVAKALEGLRAAD